MQPVQADVRIAEHRARRAHDAVASLGRAVPVAEPAVAAVAAGHVRDAAAQAAAAVRARRNRAAAARGQPAGRAIGQEAIVLAAIARARRLAAPPRHADALLRGGRHPQAVALRKHADGVARRSVHGPAVRAPIAPVRLLAPAVLVPRGVRVRGRRVRAAIGRSATGTSARRRSRSSRPAACKSTAAKRHKLLPRDPTFGDAGVGFSFESAKIVCFP